MADQRGARVLIVWVVATLAIGVAIVWAIYLARGALLLIYVSMLLAIVFGPIVRWLERHPVLRLGAR